MGQVRDGARLHAGVGVMEGASLEGQQRQAVAGCRFGKKQHRGAALLQGSGDLLRRSRGGQRRDAAQHAHPGAQEGQVEEGFFDHEGGDGGGHSAGAEEERVEPAGVVGNDHAAGGVVQALHCERKVAHQEEQPGVQAQKGRKQGRERARERGEEKRQENEKKQMKEKK